MIYRNGVFYLIVVVDAHEKTEYDPVGVLGIDQGIQNIAVHSDPKIFDNKQLEKSRNIRVYVGDYKRYGVGLPN